MRNFLELLNVLPIPDAERSVLLSQHGKSRFCSHEANTLTVQIRWFFMKKKQFAPKTEHFCVVLHAEKPWHKNYWVARRVGSPSELIKKTYVKICSLS